jgi:ubiquinone/menaquinone biosynthesis C-methylase UbiE
MFLKLREITGGGYFARNKVLKTVFPKKGSSILDIGCGSGKILRAFFQKFGNGISLNGIDSSPDLIWQAKEEDTSGKIKYKTALADDLPFPNDFFDWITVTFVAHHLSAEEKKKMIGEARRVLKPGGMIFISDVGRPEGLKGKFLAFVSGNNGLEKRNMEEIKRDLEENDLKIISDNFQFGFIEHILTRKG